MNTMLNTLFTLSFMKISDTESNITFYYLRVNIIVTYYLQKSDLVILLKKYNVRPIKVKKISGPPA